MKESKINKNIEIDDILQLESISNFSINLDKSVARLKTKNVFTNLDIELKSEVDFSLQDNLPPYPGPKTPNFDSLHSKAKELFKKADEEYYKNTNGKHLIIESGIRTVYKQAELFICYIQKKPGCNPANIPGASIHNYGLAIDVQYARNEKVISALSNNGWTRNVMPKEPWHWECIGTKAHTDAVKKQKAMKKWQPPSIARKWQEQITNAIQKQKKLKKLIPDFEKRVAKWESEWGTLGVDIEDYNNDHSDFKTRVRVFEKDRNDFNKRVEKHNQEVEKLRELRRRIERMRPSEERNRLVREYNRKAENLERENILIEERRAELEYKLSSLENEKKRITKTKSCLRKKI